MSDEHSSEDHPVLARLTPLFEACWSYDEFTRLMPWGASSEGQAIAYSTTGRVTGDSLSGSLRLSQYPRWRVDGTLLPDVHGIIETDASEQVAIRAGGYGFQVQDAPEDRIVLHWMRFWSGTPALAGLNATLAFGAGRFTNTDGLARLRYFSAAPATEPFEPPAGAPGLELLGTVNWSYPEYASVHPFGDDEGVGYATSTGRVDGGPLAGTWRGWHYPTYLRNGLYQLDAHAEIRTSEGVILNRHGGLATRSSQLYADLLHDVVQHGTFISEIPALASLNDTLAVGVGFVRGPGRVTLSYYGLSVLAEPA